MTLRATILSLLLAFAGAGAQQKFTTQIMIVPAFRGADRGLASRATDIVRKRIAADFPKSELRVVSAGDVDEWLRLSGFEENAVLTDGELREMARKFRADERVTAVVSSARGRVRVAGELSLIRDLRLVQPVAAEAPTVNEVAGIVGAEVAAARRQLQPLRQCENLLRAGKSTDAIAAAAVGIALYPRAVPARVCVLNALRKLDAPPDTSIAVARAILNVAPDNPIALEDLAGALDRQGKGDAAAPVWVRLLATDSTSEDLAERVVNALSREGNALTAQPLIDRAVDRHPDNLVLLKLRWLVHLAASDWKGAIAAGEQLLVRDAATQADPDFYARLANAYRSDSQPTRALSVAATGAARFPNNAPLYAAYVRLLRAENDAALPRGLAAFPDNPELHVLAAQSFKTSGNVAEALAETKRALAVNPRLPHGFLQLAQLEMDAGEVDSAYAAIERALENGEDGATTAQFALARGNALYKSATASQKREDFQRAMRFLSLAMHLAPTAEARFLLGASALSVGQSAANEAPATKSCDLSKLADSSLTAAETNLVGGESAAPDATRQFLDYLSKLRPYVADQIKTYC